MLAAVDRFAQAAAGHTRRRSQSTKPCKGLARGRGKDGAGRGRQAVEAALRCGLDWLQVLPLLLTFCPGTLLAIIFLALPGKTEHKYESRKRKIARSRIRTKAALQAGTNTHKHTHTERRTKTVGLAGPESLALSLATNRNHQRKVMKSSRKRKINTKINM